MMGCIMFVLKTFINFNKFISEIFYYSFFKPKSKGKNDGKFRLLKVLTIKLDKAP